MQPGAEFGVGPESPWAKWVEVEARWPALRYRVPAAILTFTMSRTKNEGKLQRSILQAIRDLPGEPTTQEIGEAIGRHHATGWAGGRPYREKGIDMWEQSYRTYTADPAVYNCLRTLRDRGLVTGTFRGWSIRAK